MKTVIAGGRDYIFSQDDHERLDRIHKKIGITEVVSGCARGADTGGEIWARINDIPIKRFPADWVNHGKSAGHIRNSEMAKYADVVVLFPGGNGTNGMYKQAEKNKLKIIDLRMLCEDTAQK